MTRQGSDTRPGASLVDGLRRRAPHHLRHPPPITVTTIINTDNSEENSS
ncbi:Uncharacterised protein [Actinomyces viscosus]|uniref:Uncharacterized protein n=1 Tax=Actinomyces viscosus TaxID=1656 RepID=A0A3S4V3P6_ACTVI|nr:Uncharacterised protein [Actinomyces viscosus]